MQENARPVAPLVQLNAGRAFYRSALHSCPLPPSLNLVEANLRQSSGKRAKYPRPRSAEKRPRSFADPAAPHVGALDLVQLTSRNLPHTMQQHDRKSTSPC